MAGQAVTPTPGMTAEWQAEQHGWVRFVRTGGALKDVPLAHRRDQVCFYASLNANNAAGDTAKSSTEKWSTDILPYIPLDVLQMGFLTGNVGHKIHEEAETAERLKEARLVQAELERKRRRNP